MALDYRCNISVVNKDGTLLDDVTVLCEDKDDTEIFSELTGATNTGKIDEQTITYKDYTFGANQSTTLSPHKFTLSLAGYETLVHDNDTVDGPIDWHFEMLPAHGAWPKAWR